MRILYKRMIVFLIAAHSFCCGMDEGGFVLVKTKGTNVTLFETSKINQSLVLSVLYAHQKKKNPKMISIPNACRATDTILTKDVRALHCLLDNQGDRFVPYMNGLSYRERIDCAHAAHVLGAQHQLSKVIDYFFIPDIASYIGSKMITDDVQEYMIKQIIKKREATDPVSITVSDCGLCSDKNGSCFYIPLEIVHYQGDVFFDGYRNVALGAMSCNGNYYISGVGVSDNDEAVSLSCNNTTVLKKQTKLLDKGVNVTHVVFDSNETCLVMASKATKDNLLFWLLGSLDDDEESYILEGHAGLVGKVIVNNEGTCIVSSDKEEADVIVWDMVGKTAQRLLYDDLAYPVGAMSLSGDGKRLWACSGAVILLWQKVNEEQFEFVNSITLDKDNAVICRMLVNEQAGYIVVGRTDGKLNVISIDIKKEIVCLEGHKEVPINGLIGRGGGTIVVSSTNDIADNVMVWDVSTGKRLANLIGHAGIISIVLTPDMRYIVSQSRQNICLWSMYGQSEETVLNYIKKELKFLNCYELYSLYKKIKNGYTPQEPKADWLASWPNVLGLKEFLEKYLL